MARPPLGLRPAEADDPQSPSPRVRREERGEGQGQWPPTESDARCEADRLAPHPNPLPAMRGEGTPNVLSLAEMRSTVRNDFYSFLVRCFAELHGGKTFSPAWHAEVLAAKLQGVRDGGVKRLVVNVPPRHLKSLAASVALPAWLLGHDPSLAVVNVTSPRTCRTSSPATVGR
jgi:hypothetical protein